MQKGICLFDEQTVSLQKERRGAPNNTCQLGGRRTLAAAPVLALLSIAKTSLARAATLPYRLDTTV
jgi:hypothetical protein